MRKTKTVVIDSDDPTNRDKGKIFVLREMPASVAERWATRALMLLTRANVDLPDGVQTAGFAAIAAAGFQSLSRIDYDDLKPLLDEMWQCVEIRPDARNQFTRILQWEVPGTETEADIQEISTMLKLRLEVFTLHVGFSIPGVNSNSSNSSTTLTPAALQNTQTSPPRMAAPSGRRLPPGKRRS